MRPNDVEGFPHRLFHCALDFRINTKYVSRWAWLCVCVGLCIGPIPSIHCKMQCTVRVNDTQKII